MSLKVLKSVSESPWMCHSYHICFVHYTS